MVAYEIEYKQTDEGLEYWVRYRAEKCKPFMTKPDAEEFLKSAKEHCEAQKEYVEFRIIEVPLPWGRQ